MPFYLVKALEIKGGGSDEHHLALPVSSLTDRILTLECPEEKWGFVPQGSLNHHVTLKTRKAIGQMKVKQKT